MSFNFDTDVLKGDWVMYSSHPDSPSMPALVVSKGNDSLEVIAYAWNGAVASASHKSGVRHKYHPIFNDPVAAANILNDGDSGVFTLHPTNILIKQLCERIEELEAKVLKGVAKKPKLEAVSAPEPEVKPDLSFRMDESAPELTAEQKAEKRSLLESVR